MLNTLLGVLIGLLLAIIAMLAVRRYQIPIERTIKQLENKVREKGEIFTIDEEVEDLKAWADSLPTEDGGFSNHPGFNK